MAGFSDNLWVSRRMGHQGSRQGDGTPKGPSDCAVESRAVESRAVESRAAHVEDIEDLEKGELKEDVELTAIEVVRPLD